MNVGENPWSFQSARDNTQDNFPNTNIYIQRIQVMGGPNDGTFMLMDHPGHTLYTGNGKWHADVDIRVREVVLRIVPR